MLIYKICTRALWEETKRTGVFPGMEIDVQDGYIHFSTAAQNVETARKYFADKKDLMLLSVDTDTLGDALVWEPSSSRARAGDFPHLYGPLKREAVVEAVHFSVPKADISR